MSYSFSVQAKTKAEAKEKAEASIKSCVEPQSAHAADVAAIRATCSAFVDALPDPRDDEEVMLTCWGSCSGVWNEAPFRMNQTEITTKASLVAAAKDAAA